MEAAEVIAIVIRVEDEVVAETLEDGVVGVGAVGGDVDISLLNIALISVDEGSDAVLYGEWGE